MADSDNAPEWPGLRHRNLFQDLSDADGTIYLDEDFGFGPPPARTLEKHKADWIARLSEQIRLRTDFADLPRRMRDHWIEDWGFGE